MEKQNRILQLVNTVNPREPKPEDEIIIEFVQDGQDALNGQLPQFKMFPKEHFSKTQNNDSVEYRIKAFEQEVKAEVAVLNAMKKLIEAEEKKKQLNIELPTASVPTKQNLEPTESIPIIKLTDISSDIAPINKTNLHANLLPPPQKLTSKLPLMQTVPTKSQMQPFEPQANLLPKTKQQQTPENFENVSEKITKNVKPKKRKQPNKGCLFRKQSGIETLPTFIDGDRSIKTVNIYDHCFSVDMRCSEEELFKPRFGNDEQIDTVILGENGTAVSKLSLNIINWWAEPSDCVRKVIATVFDREVLARSNLTGRGSPAFHDVDMPKKDKLDPEKVADITEFMMEQLPITAKDVRRAIVTKCADDVKWLRKRLANEIGDKENKQPANKKLKITHKN